MTREEKLKEIDILVDAYDAIPVELPNAFCAVTPAQIAAHEWTRRRLRKLIARKVEQVDAQSGEWRDRFVKLYRTLGKWRRAGARKDAPSTIVGIDDM